MLKGTTQTIKIIFSSVLFFMLLAGFSASAQNLTGIWRGGFYNEFEYQFFGSKYRYEVQIKATGESVKGVTYSYQDTRFYGKAGSVGKWSSSTKSLTLVENKMLELKIQGGGDGCLMTCYLNYRKEGNKEFLEGRYSSVNMNDTKSSCGGGIVRLERVPDTDFTLEPFLREGNQTAKNTKPGQDDYLINRESAKGPPPVTRPAPKKEPPVAKKDPVPDKPQPKITTPEQPKPQATPPPVVTKPAEPKKNNEESNTVRNRQNELVETISTGSRKLSISFYDNGEIDGDIISVYANGKLIVDKQTLSANPIYVEVELNEQTDLQEIVMVAENLGAIPPNTALMIIQAGAQRFTLSLSSNEQKNAMVRFRFQPEL